jgi:hypothetical protein
VHKRLIGRPLGGRHAKSPRAAVLGVALVSAFGLWGCTSQAATPPPSGISKIRHVVIIMQENRSFDSFFGTYPGADGIPASNGQFTVCVPDARTKGCDRPYHDASLVNGGALHDRSEAIADIDGGKMDGFVRTAEDQPSRGCSATNPPTPSCLPSNAPDVMGYHDAREIPNYWKYAEDFALNDHMFEPVASWSLPAHLYTVSGWSAHCTSTSPASCKNDPSQGGGVAGLVPAAFRACLQARGITVEGLVQADSATCPRPRRRRPTRACRSSPPPSGRRCWPRGQRREHPAWGVLMDRPHVSAAQARRALGLLRAAWHLARL